MHVAIELSNCHGLLAFQVAMEDSVTQAPIRDGFKFVNCSSVRSSTLRFTYIGVMGTGTCGHFVRVRVRVRVRV